ncbi:MAG TPA: lytic transglycosylase domain-containing protein [Bryobacteraceae bacterium]
MIRWIWILTASAAAAQTGVREQMQASIAKQRAAAAIQREAVRKQAAAVGSQLASASPVPDDNCEPLSEAVVEPMIMDAARVQELQPKLLRAVIEQESGYRPCAVSRKGAQGLMQLMPSTAEDLGVKNPFDPKLNIAGGAKFLKILLEKYRGDLARALGAYNAGPATVDDAGGVPDIAETKGYVHSILRRISQ